MRRLLYLAFLISATTVPSVYANHINWGTSGQPLYAADGETLLPGNRERNETTTGFIQLLWLGPNGVYDGLTSTGDGTKGDDQVIAQSWVGDGNLVFLSDTPGQFDATDNPPSAAYASSEDSFAIHVFDSAVSDADWTAGNIPASGHYKYVVFTNPTKVANFYDLWIDAKLTVDIPLSPLSWTLSILTPGGAGETDPAVGEYAYNLNEGAEVAAIPDFGWVLNHWLVDGENAGDDNPVTVPAVELGKTSTLQAVFVRKQYTLTYTAGANGAIDGEPEVVQAVLHGDDGEPVTASPAEGHRFDQWNDGVTTATRTDMNVVDNLNVTAEFEPKWVPTIAWPAPEAIAYGAALSGAQLDAVADTSGAFVYDPPAGTVLPAGVHTLTATFTPADGDNWTAAVATVELTVTKAPLTVRADDKTRPYGQANPPLTWTATGFVAGDDASALAGAPELACAATPESPVADGPYPIAITQGTLAAANYAFAFVDGSLTLTRADQTIVFAAPPAKSYGDEPFALEVAASSGLPVALASGEPAVATVAEDHGEWTATIHGAGETTLTATQPGDGNWNPAEPVARVLQVLPPVDIYHSADTNEDGRIDLFEYLNYAGPVAAVYQRGINGGEYEWDGTTLVPVTAGRGTRDAHGSAAVEEVGAHPADANADGRIDLFEYLNYAGPVAAVYQRGINGGEYDWDEETLTPRTNASRSVGIRDILVPGFAYWLFTTESEATLTVDVER